MINSIMVFISIIVMVSFVISIGFLLIIEKLMLVFIVIKKRFNNKFLNGLILVLSLCLNLLFVKIILVKNVLRVGERFISFISVVIFIMSMSVVVVKIFCKFDVVINLNKGWFK